MQIKKVGVLGCGLMGSGIVEVCAKAGYEVIVREVNDELLSKGLGRLDTSLNTAVEKGKLKKDERDAARARIRGTTQVADMSDADVVIEAIVEDRAAKREIWTEIGKKVKKEALLATNTSSIPLSSFTLRASSLSWRSRSSAEYSALAVSEKSRSSEKRTSRSSTSSDTFRP